MRSEHAIVTTVEQLMAASDHRLLVAGELVFCAMDAQPELPDYIPQPPLFAQRGLVARLRRATPRLYLAVNSALTAKSGAKIGFAIEGYLNWGFRQPGSQTAILIGGGVGRSEQNLVICVFGQGRVLAVEERQLPLAGSFDWDDSVKALIESLLEKYPDARLYQAGPLPDWGVEKISYVGVQPFERLRFRALHASGVTPGVVLAPVAILGVGVLGYALGAGYGYYLYSQKVEEYRIAVSNPVVVKHGGLDEGVLSMLEKKEDFLKKPSSLASLVPEAVKLANQLSEEPGINLLELQFPVATRAAAPTPDTAQFLITVSAKSSKESFLEQAASVMRTISERTGLVLRLVSRGDSKDGQSRTFKLEALPATSGTKGETL